MLDRAKKTGPYGFLGKPVNISDLSNVVEMALYKHEADKKVRASEARQAKAEELAGLHSWDWDIRSDRLAWSKETFRAFGIPNRQCDITFDLFINSVHPEDRGRVRRAITEALDGTRPYEIEFKVLQPDGEIKVLFSRGEIERDSGGRPVRMSGMALDITHRKQTEEALRESEERNRLLSEMTFEAIAFHDRGILVDANPQYFEMLGYEPHEIIGREILSKTIAPEYLGTVDSFVKSDFTQRYETVLQRKDGSRMPIRIRPTLRNPGELRRRFVRKQQGGPVS